MARMEEMVDFSEIGEFIDMPVRTHSGGMHLRLVFAIRMHVDRSLLLLDETLNVGDGGFREKWKEALLRLIVRGITTILVSHTLTDFQGDLR
ncbi:MAG TPA: hypothetical protein VLJ79_00215 [Candidatus Binatia bacterium]|nr:hypothetical protein [Candidatus Binatia bacterium]